MSQQTYNISLYNMYTTRWVDAVYMLYKCVMFAGVGQRFCEIGIGG